MRCWRKPQHDLKRWILLLFILKPTFEVVSASLPWYFHQSSTYSQSTPILTDSSRELWISTLVPSSNSSANVQTPIQVLTMWQYSRSRKFDLFPSNSRKHGNEVVEIVSGRVSIVMLVPKLCDRCLWWWWWWWWKKVCRWNTITQISKSEFFCKINFKFPKTI